MRGCMRRSPVAAEPEVLAASATHSIRGWDVLISLPPDYEEKARQRNTFNTVCAH